MWGSCKLKSMVFSIDIGEKMHNHTKNGLNWPRDPICHPRKLWVRPNFGLAHLKWEILMISKSGDHDKLVCIPKTCVQFF